MRMSLTRIHVLVLAIGSIALSACAHDTALAPTSHSMCQAISPGSIINAKIYSDLDYWDYQWSGDNFSLMQHGRDKSQDIGVDDIASILSKFSTVNVAGDPQVYRLERPGSVSPDGKYLLATLTPTAGQGTSRIGLFSVTDQKLVQLLDSARLIKATAWAPDSQSYVTLENEDVSSTRSPKDLTAAAFGWKIHYYDMFISIYAQDGKQECSVQVAKQLAQGTGKLQWIVVKK